MRALVPVVLLLLVNWKWKLHFLPLLRIPVQIGVTSVDRCFFGILFESSCILSHHAIFYWMSSWRLWELVSLLKSFLFNASVAYSTTLLLPELKLFFTPDVEYFSMMLKYSINEIFGNFAHCLQQTYGVAIFKDKPLYPCLGRSIFFWNHHYHHLWCIRSVCIASLLFKLVHTIPGHVWGLRISWLFQKSHGLIKYLSISFTTWLSMLEICMYSESLVRNAIFLAIGVCLIRCLIACGRYLYSMNLAFVDLLVFYKVLLMSCFGASMVVSISLLLGLGYPTFSWSFPIYILQSLPSLIILIGLVFCLLKGLLGFLSDDLSWKV